MVAEGTGCEDTEDRPVEEETGGVIVSVLLFEGEMPELVEGGKESAPLPILTEDSVKRRRTFFFSSSVFSSSYPKACEDMVKEGACGLSG